MQVNTTQSNPQNTINKNKPITKKQYAKAACASLATLGVAKIATYSINGIIGDYLSKVNQKYNPKNIVEITDKALKLTGLEKLGVKFADIHLLKTKNICTEQKNKNLLNEVIKGQTGYYNTGNKTIYVNRDKIGLISFHEMGHTLNHQKSKLGKLLLTMRNPTAKLATVILPLIALATNKPDNNEEQKGFLNKTRTFIKNNVGKLSFLAFMPILTEEALATIKGNKIASKLLDASTLSKVKKGNWLGFATYLIEAVALSSCAYLANSIRDKIVHKPNK